jgi:hypothetical protein
MSENAIRDQNYRPAKLAVLNTDTIQGTNLVRIKIDETSGGIKKNTTDTISVTMQPVTPQDENYVDCWLFEGTDGLLYPAVANANGELLVDE